MHTNNVQMKRFSKTNKAYYQNRSTSKKILIKCKLCSGIGHASDVCPSEKNIRENIYD